MKYIFIILTISIFIGCSSKPVDGADLYTKNCSNCHGELGRKSAFGKSKVISNWSKEKIIKAILGYQEKTYGGSMKNLMRIQVKSLSEEEVNAIAEHISSINN